MYLHSRVIIALQIASCLMTATFAVEGAAQEFAVQNKVMQGSAVRSETRTLITPDAYYDIVFKGKDPIQASVYFRNRRQYYFVDFKSKTNATIDDTDVRNFVAQVVSRAKTLRNPHVQFAADPKFVEQLDAKTLKLDSDLWTYKVALESSRDSDAVDTYREFADSFARLNAFTSFPPNARLKLNEATHRAGALPSRVEVDLKDGTGKSVRKQVTVHNYDWKLSASDRKVIDAAKTGIVEFKKVSFADFRGMNKGQRG